MTATPPAQGRSLSKSIIVGLALGGAFLLSVLIYKELFMVLAALAAGAGAWELSSALRIKGWYVPRVPSVVGSVLIMPATFYWGERGQWLTSLAIVLSLILWRTVHLLWERKDNSQSLKRTLRDFAAAAFVVIYLPLTTSFTILLLRRPDENGKWWVVMFVVTVAMIDTFGYLVGRKFGAHKMAPGVSPKKSWEGLLASITAGSISAVLFTVFLLGGQWWHGVIMAAALLLAAVFGDLAESLIKRDLGVKDMSSVLPGHGGVMDRMDSILPAGLIAYIISQLFFAL